MQRPSCTTSTLLVQRVFISFWFLMNSEYIVGLVCITTIDRDFSDARRSLMLTAPSGKEDAYAIFLQQSGMSYHQDVT